MSFQPVIGSIGKEMLNPRPARADRIEDRLGTGGVGEVSRGEVHHQEAPVRIDSDMTLAPDHLLGSVKAPRFGVGRLDGLAVEQAAGGAFFPAGSLPRS